MARPSIHVEPRGAAAIARHYVRDLVYGANDGIITTFAVVSGVTDGELSHVAILIIGAANLAADGMSMGAGNLLAIRAEERAREAADLSEQEAFPWKYGLATLAAFVTAGLVPLLPFLWPLVDSRAAWSARLTFAALFLLGASRSLVTVDRWWRSGLKTLLLGALVAAAADGAGVVGASLIRP